MCIRIRDIDNILCCLLHVCVCVWIWFSGGCVLVQSVSVTTVALGEGHSRPTYIGRTGKECSRGWETTGIAPREKGNTVEDIDFFYVVMYINICESSHMHNNILISDSTVHFTKVVLYAIGFTGCIRRWFHLLVVRLTWWCVGLTMYIVFILQGEIDAREDNFTRIRGKGEV